ncbi:MFS transporter [Kitasatospora herbaricolor]|uniref:MFS transporter n=1 Tax=Kitasatospora herbaricolor TaxID=68217 RepID=UPI00174853D5|nr:MFS transporter [Kitasatospora herbaricolor]MDQ0306410.1 DHA1 family inner membrane transport protein [Kitasatospora herbaricolor]GGV42481.1 MFS transporter [Kitasatospora herbaricolor]
MPLALVALAITAFAIGTTEFAAMGLLPQVADDLQVSIPQAGWLISAYAIGVVIGAPLLTAAAARMPRKAVLVGLAALFTVGNLLCALAPNFWLLAAARLITGLPHGAFFGAGAVAAAELAAPHLRARAVAVMFSGLTLANVVGVPAATLLGQQLGWRATMLVVVAIGAAGTLAIARLVPHLPAPERAGLRHELSAFRSGQLWLALGTVVFGCGGFFACYSYITPLLTEVSGFTTGSVTGVLALFGVGMTVGNVVGGYAADRALRPGICASFVLLALTLAAFSVTARAEWSAALTVVLVGLFGFAIVPGVQTLVLQKARNAPTLASATVQGAFNLANAQGAFFGGLAIDAGLGWTAPPLVGAGLAGIGALIAVLAWAADRRACAGPGTGPADGKPAAASVPVASAH